MNNKRRSELKKATILLDTVYQMVDTACDQEQDCLDNIPDNLWYSNKCQDMENAVTNMEDACALIEEACGLIVEAMG